MIKIYQPRPAGAGYGEGEKQNKQRVKRLRKEPEMAYKKPQIVAKSAAKQTFVAGCGSGSGGCHAFCHSTTLRMN